MLMYMENWKQIPIVPAYEVSDLGRVRRLKPGCATRPGRIVRGFDKSDGYHRVLLAIEPNKYRLFVTHRLVMAAFVGPSTLHVNHKNGVRNDNRLENLEYVTRSQNQCHARDVLGTFVNGSRNGRAKLTEADVLEIRRLRNEGVIVRKLAEQFGVHKNMIQSIIYRKAWTHL